MTHQTDRSRPRRGLGTRLLDLLLRIPGLRQRVAFHLRQEHFAELRLRVPLGGGLDAPIHAHENLYSFGEIFCAHEYEPAWRHLPLPQRWLDLGAHAGYFSLQLAARHAAASRDAHWQALLVEPDPRMRAVIEDGIHSNGLASRLRLLGGLLCPGSGAAAFTLRHGMVSSADAEAIQGGRTITVPIIDEATILAALPPPYDLIKLDIEGGEYDFVRAYPQICRAARACLIEWHAADPGDSRRTELARTLQGHGLSRRIELRAPGRGVGDGPLSWTGLELYLREAAP